MIRWWSVEHLPRVAASYRPILRARTWAVVVVRKAPPTIQSRKP